MHTINLKSEVVVKPAVVASTARLLNVVDSYAQKRVVATVAFGEGVGIHQVLIWKDADYDKAGQWTDTDLFAALEPAVEAFIAKGFKNEEEKQPAFPQLIKNRQAVN